MANGFSSRPSFGTVEPEEEQDSIFKRMGLSGIQTPQQADTLSPLLTSIIKGRLENVVEPPQETFNEFFDERHKRPALAILGNFFKGFSDVLGGGEFKSLRQRTLEEYQTQQTIRQREKQLEQQKLGNAINAALTLTRLEQQKELAQTKAEAQAIQQQFDNELAVLKFNNDVTRLDDQLKTNQVTRETAKARLDEIKSRPVFKGSPFEFVLDKLSEENEGTLPDLQQVLDLGGPFLRAMNKLQARDQEFLLQASQSNVEALANQVAEGGITFTQLAGMGGRNPALQEGVIGSLVQNNKILQTPKFRTESANIVSGLESFESLRDLAVQARSIKAPENDPGFMSRVRGTLDELFGTLGENEFANVAGAFVPAEATKLARAYGEQRVSDADVIRFIKPFVKVTNTPEETELKVKVFTRKAVSEIVNRAQSLGQMSKPSRQPELSVKREEIPALAKRNNMSIVEYIVSLLETGIAIK